MGEHREKYAKLSLEGRWITLAQEVIADNPGITKDEFVALAAPWMPMHVVVSGVKAGKIRLAKHALVKADYIEKDGKMYPKAKQARRHEDCYGQILAFAKTCDKFSTKDIPHIEYFSTRCRRLVKKGLLERVDDKHYRLKR